MRGLPLVYATPDRTQEVAGSSPASSIVRSPPSGERPPRVLPGGPRRADRRFRRTWCPPRVARAHQRSPRSARSAALWRRRGHRHDPGVLFLSIAGSVGKPVITRIKCRIHDGCTSPGTRGALSSCTTSLRLGGHLRAWASWEHNFNLNTETVSQSGATGARTGARQRLAGGRGRWPPAVSKLAALESSVHLGLLSAAATR